MSVHLDTVGIVIIVVIGFLILVGVCVCLVAILAGRMDEPGYHARQHNGIGVPSVLDSITLRYGRENALYDCGYPDCPWCEPRRVTGTYHEHEEVGTPVDGMSS